MTAKDKIKILIDQMPDKEFDLIEPFLINMLGLQKKSIPKGNLGLKRDLERTELHGI